MIEKVIPYGRKAASLAFLLLTFAFRGALVSQRCTICIPPSYCNKVRHLVRLIGCKLRDLNEKSVDKIQYSD